MLKRLAMNSFSLRVFGFVLTGLLSGCGVFCSEVGCVSAVGIQLATPWQAGKYNVQVVSKTGTATFAACTIDFANFSNRYQDCPAIGYWGNSDTTISTLEFSFEGPRPSEVTITITPDGGTPESTTKQLDYSKSAPNGEQCGPICYQANVVL